MRNLFIAVMLFALPFEWAEAECPDVLTAKSGLPGRINEWTTTYDLRAGTFTSHHVSGNTVTGKVKATCGDGKVLLQESDTSNANDGRCELNRVDAQHYRGTCLPRGFEIRIAGSGL
jgi:hypothetical protein